MPDPSAVGEAVFARYAFPPNDLGHCGPAGAEALLAVGSGAPRPGSRVEGDDPGGAVRRRARQFDGAWPYLQLLAGAAGVEDPLDAAVVTAYWLEEGMLARTDPEAFAATVQRHFGGQPGVLDRALGTPEVWQLGPGHTFHVFVVYPWVGLLHAGGDVARSILDSCRVRWGTVTAVDGDAAEVRLRPLTWGGGQLSLGEEQPEVCRWRHERQAFVHDLRPGDRVSVHWAWICDRLTVGQVTRLEGVLARQLQVTNHWLKEGAGQGVR